MNTENNNQAYKYSDITKKIIGASIEVHKTIGNGFQELIYQRSLAIELTERKISFEREKEIYYIIKI